MWQTVDKQITVSSKHRRHFSSKQMSCGRVPISSSLQQIIDSGEVRNVIAAKEEEDKDPPRARPSTDIRQVVK